MSKFVLTAQLQLQAPNNVSQIVSQIQNQLNNVSVNVQVKGSAQANKQLQQITQSTNAATTAAGRMGNAFAVSIRRFAAFSIATRAVGLFTSTLADAVKTAIDFERELIKISQVTGRSVSSLRDLTDSVTNLSTGLGVTSQSLLEVTTVLTQAGLSSDDTKIALESLAKAALAPNFDSISETAEGAIAILAQFKQGVGALEGQLSSIDAVAGAFAVEAGDLIDVIRRSGGVFKASGGSLNELLALFTSVRATTRESAESIGTGLRTIFTRIQRPETIEFLKQFGVELVDLNGKFVGPYEAIKRLSEAISGLGEGDLTFIKIAEELGGFRQIGKVLPLLQQFSTAQAALNVAQNAGNGLTKNAEMAQASLAIRIIKVREEFLALVRSVTETTTFQVMANTALALASALIKIADSIKPLLPLLAAVAAFKAVKGIGGFLGGIGAGLTSGKTFHYGGKVLAFAKGGLVPGSGSGTADDVPAMVSSGEFVMKKSAVQRIGANNLAAMNRGGTAQKFAGGGMVNHNRHGYGTFTANSRAMKLAKRPYSDKAWKALPDNEKQRLAALSESNNPNPQNRPKGQEGAKGQVRNITLSQPFGVSFLKGFGSNVDMLSTINDVFKYGNNTGTKVLKEAILKSTGKKSISEAVPAGAKISATKATATFLDPKGYKIFEDDIASTLPKAFDKAAKNFNGELDVSSPPKSINQLLSKSAINSIEGQFFEAFVRSVTGNVIADDGKTDAIFDFTSMNGTKKANELFGVNNFVLPNEFKNEPNRRNVASSIAKGLSLGAGFTRIQKFAIGGRAKGIEGAPLVDDIPNASGSILPRPSAAIQALIKAGGGAVDVDRTLKRTVGDTAYAKAPTPGAKNASLDTYFRDEAKRLQDLKTAPITQFGKELQVAIKSGQLDARKISIISKSKRVKGAAEYLSSQFGIPVQNMVFTQGASKQPAIDAIRNKGSRIERVKRFLGGIIPQRFALGGMGKPSRKVDYESGVGPSPFASQKSNKLGQEVYALQKSSGLNNLEFGDIVQTANTLGYNTIPQFKQYLAKRVAEKKNKSQLKTDVPSLLSSLKDDARPQTTPAQAAMVQQLSGPEATPQAKRLSPQAEKLRIMLGGKPRAFASGGLVPGVGNSDTVPATLQEGDFVIRKSSVGKLGAENLASMAGYAAGGNVSKSVPALLTPGEFVFDEPSAKSIGYGNLNRMNKVGKYAAGGFVGVQKFATGTAGKGAKAGIGAPIGATGGLFSLDIGDKIVKDLKFNATGDIFKTKLMTIPALLMGGTSALANEIADIALSLGILDNQIDGLGAAVVQNGQANKRSIQAQAALIAELRDMNFNQLVVAKDKLEADTAAITGQASPSAKTSPSASSGVAGAGTSNKQGINVQQVYLDAIKADYKESFQQIKNAHDQEVKSAQASGKTQQEIANITNQYKQQVQQLNTNTISKIKSVQASVINASATAGTVLPNTSSAKVTPSSGVAIASSGKSKAGSSGAGSPQDAQGGLIALTLLPSIIQSMIPPIDENSSAITRMTNSLLSMATTVGGVIFALQSFGVSLNVDKLKTLLGTGSGSLGDIIGGITSSTKGGKRVIAQRTGESFKEAFQTGKIDGQIKNLRDSAPNRAGSSRTYDAGSGRFSRNDTPMEQLSRQSRADQIRELRTQRSSTPSPTSVTGKFAQTIGKVSNQGGTVGNATNAAMNSANFVGKSFQSVGSGIGSGVQLAASKVGLGNVASSAGAKLTGAMTGITQAAGPLITNLVSLAGPLVAIGGSALVVSSVFNTLISSMYDYDNQLKKAISKGDVSKAGKVAGQKYELEAANKARTAGATVGAGIGFFLGGPIGSAIGATIGAGIGTLFANAAPGLTESLNILFGGNTKASAIALAEAQAQAVKTSQALAEAQTTAEKSIKDFQAGTITAAEALRKVQSATQEVNTLQQKNEKAVAKNNENKSEIGSGAIARNLVAYLGGGVGLLGVETADTRNKRIDSENSKTIEGQKASILQANDINKQVGLATARTSILSSVKAGKTREEIAAGLDSQLGDSGPQAIRKQASEAFSKAMAANKRGDTETGSAYEEQAKALRKQAEDYEQSISNLIKEQERLEKSLQALNLGLRGPAAGAGAAAAELQNFAAQIEGTALPAVNAIGLLEASATSAGAAMDKASLDKANEQVASTLKDLGASPEQVTKFQGMSGAFNSAQVKYKDVAQQIKDEQSASGKSFSPEEIRKKFAEKLGEGAPEEFKNIINGIELTDAIKDQIARDDYSGIADALGEQGKKFFEPVQKVLQDYQKAQDVVVKLTKERIEAERGYIQSVREAQDLMMEGREIQSKYGGPKLTIEERRASVLTKANASNSLTGLPALSSASGADFTARSQAIQGRFASNQQQINAGEGAGTKSGEQLRQQQQDLKQAQKDQIQTIRELVKLEEENLKLISEKNKLERDSIDSLVSGDIEKFFDQQAAVGAQAAIATGDQRLIGQFGMSALGGAAQETKRQQEAGVTSMYGQNLAGPGGLTERAYGSAISAAGVQNPLAMAQVAAGTTGEEEASKARLRELGGALGETGQLGQDLSQIDVATATMNVANAEVILNNAIEKGKALGTELMANGGMVYASRGIFVPRGTDTVPAMLTPGEFVVNRAAVQRGNNLSILQTMNRGVSASAPAASSQSGDVAAMATGGIVRYRSGGSTGPESGGAGISAEALNAFAAALSQFNTELTKNIKTLSDTKFQITLNPTNINVNLTGTSFLANLTSSIKQDLLKFLGEEISNYSVGNDGKLRKSGSTLGTIT